MERLAQLVKQLAQIRAGLSLGRVWPETEQQSVIFFFVSLCLCVELSHRKLLCNSGQTPGGKCWKKSPLSAKLNHTLMTEATIARKTDETFS
jgi:hypothetical protein